MAANMHDNSSARDDETDSHETHTRPGAVATLHLI
jgi:hypothetical protein